MPNFPVEQLQKIFSFAITMTYHQTLLNMNTMKQRKYTMPKNISSRISLIQICCLFSMQI